LLLKPPVTLTTRWSGNPDLAVGDDADAEPHRHHLAHRFARRHLDDAAAEVGTDVVITLDGDNVLTLVGTKLTALQDDDFRFVA
jgi:hypothetical protein